jgi:hypothetical protein
MKIPKSKLNFKQLWDNHVFWANAKKFRKVNIHLDYPQDGCSSFECTIIKYEEHYE